jgi:hypothetical protein
MKLSEELRAFADMNASPKEKERYMRWAARAELTENVLAEATVARTMDSAPEGELLLFDTEVNAWMREYWSNGPCVDEDEDDDEEPIYSHWLPLPPRPTASGEET